MTRDGQNTEVSRFSGCCAPDSQTIEDKNQLNNNLKIAKLESIFSLPVNDGSGGRGVAVTPHLSGRDAKVAQLAKSQRGETTRDNIVHSAEQIYL